MVVGRVSPLKGRGLVRHVDDERGKRHGNYEETRSFQHPHRAEIIFL